MQTYRSVSFAVLNYAVEVYTGSMPNASTDATVHIMLVGERGDTGKRLLLKPLSTDKKPFRLGQVSFFSVLLNLILPDCSKKKSTAPMLNVREGLISLTSALEPTVDKFQGPGHWTSAMQNLPFMFQLMPLPNITACDRGTCA